MHDLPQVVAEVIGRAAVPDVTGDLLSEGIGVFADGSERLLFWDLEVERLQGFERLLKVHEGGLAVGRPGVSLLRVANRTDVALPTKQGAESESATDEVSE